MLLTPPRRVSFRLPGSTSRVDFGSDTIEDVVISAIDHIEDEIDAHAYDDFIPLNVRIALEENVFGWSHLMSDIFGHIFFTLSAYFITYQMVTWIMLRPVSIVVVDESMDSIQGDSGGDENCQGTISCLLYRSMGWFHPHQKQQSSSDTNDVEYGLKYMPIFDISYQTFTFVRVLLSSMAALHAFRVVRRRRRVWLRTPNGEFYDDADHRLEEADRTTLLGRIRSKVGEKTNAILANRVKKKIHKAERRFERRRKHRANQLANGLSHHQAMNHHHRVRVLAESGSLVKGSIDRRRRRRNGRSGVIYHQTADSHRNRSLVDSHTLPTYVMQSIAQDQLRFQSGHIDNVPYSHGGFFGAAPFMLANPFWIDVLRHLMPDVYVEISRRVVYAEAPKLIHWAENNPVMAAYGTAHEFEYSGKVSTLEWDVFLDPNLVRRLEIVLTERDKFLRSRATIERSRQRSSSEDEPPSAPSTPSSPLNAADTTFSQSAITTENELTILRYYNNEIKRRTDILLDRMLIAHGNTTQLILEQTGYLKTYNFSRVKRTRRTLGGGIFARQWLAVFAEAIKMGMGDGEECSKATVDEKNKKDNGIFLPNLAIEEDEVKTYGSSTFPSSGNLSPRSLSSSSDEDYNFEAIPLLTSKENQGSDSFHQKQVQSSGCGSNEKRENSQYISSDNESLSSSPGYKNVGRDESITMDDTTDVNSGSYNKAKRKKKKKRGCYKEGDYNYCDGSCMQNEDGQCGNCSCCASGGNFLFEQQRIPSSPRSAKKISHQSKITHGTCTRPKRSKAGPTSLSSLGRALIPDTSIPDSIAILKDIMKCNAPFGLVLDIKSRHVPKRIWGIVIDALREAGARVEGIGTFSMEDIRDISAYCSSPVKEICFFSYSG
uniref:Uncharacterized protein n=1 Tax=Ditylum brightwellii TaxID=49249 RepID=A0A7S4VYF9_9STRA